MSDGLKDKFKSLLHKEGKTNNPASESSKNSQTKIKIGESGQTNVKTTVGPINTGTQTNTQNWAETNANFTKTGFQPVAPQSNRKRLIILGAIAIGFVILALEDVIIPKKPTEQVSNKDIKIAKKVPQNPLKDRFNKKDNTGKTKAKSTEGKEKKEVAVKVENTETSNLDIEVKNNPEQAVVEGIEEQNKQINQNANIANQQMINDVESKPIETGNKELGVTGQPSDEAETGEVESVDSTEQVLSDLMDMSNDISGEVGDNEKKVENMIKNEIEEDSKKEKKFKEFQPPPNYELFGRGLVYNCKGGHWACIDKKSYFECKNNEMWSNQNNKNKSCKIFDVYASNRDCELAQIYNVNLVKDTSFCN